MSTPRTNGLETTASTIPLSNSTLVDAPSSGTVVGRPEENILEIRERLFDSLEAKRKPIDKFLNSKNPYYMIARLCDRLMVNEVEGQGRKVSPFFISGITLLCSGIGAMTSVVAIMSGVMLFSPTLTIALAGYAIVVLVLGVALLTKYGQLHSLKKDSSSRDTCYKENSLNKMYEELCKELKQYPNFLECEVVSKYPEDYLITMVIKCNSSEELQYELPASCQDLKKRRKEKIKDLDAKLAEETYSGPAKYLLKIASKNQGQDKIKKLRGELERWAEEVGKDLKPITPTSNFPASYTYIHNQLTLEDALAQYHFVCGNQGQECLSILEQNVQIELEKESRLKESYYHFTKNPRNLEYKILRKHIKYLKELIEKEREEIKRLKSLSNV